MYIILQYNTLTHSYDNLYLSLVSFLLKNRYLYVARLFMIVYTSTKLLLYCSICICIQVGRG